jgi:hypothetical protein
MNPPTEYCNADHNATHRRRIVVDALPKRVRRVRSLWESHPFLTFVIAPLPLTLLVYLGIALTILLFCTAVTMVSIPNLADSTGLDVIAFHCFGAILAYVPASIASLLLCRFAKRKRFNWHWPIIACLLTAMFAFCCTWSVRPGHAGDQPMIKFGLMMGFQMLYRIPQVLAPIAIGCFAFWHRPYAHMR